MILRLNGDYWLRGWKGASCGLVHNLTKQVTFYTPQDFQLLLLCDGISDLDESLLSDQEQQMLRNYLDQGILEICDKESPLDEEQVYRVFSNRFVRFVLWSVTGRCNFQCRHCYMDAPNGMLGEITHEEAISIIDQMADCGIYDIALTGGEPLVRSDIRELISRISERGMKISQIYTNAWLVDEELLDYLEGVGQKPEFNISFDGLRWHDWMRGVEGAEAKVLDVIRLCQRRGFSTGVEVSLHKDSLESLRDTVRLMGSLNTRLKVGSIMNTELWQKKGQGKSLTEEEYFRAMIDYIPEFFEDGMPADVVLGSVIQLRKGSSEYRVIAEKYDGTESCLDHRMCGAARMTAYISPEGRLLPCLPITSWDGQDRFPRIQEIGLKAGLTDGFYMNFVNGRIRELFEKNETCDRCEYKLRCGGGCRAIALEEGDDPYGCDTKQCFFWKNGYVDIIREVTETAIEKYCK